jgi:hypothetical protein
MWAHFEVRDSDERDAALLQDVTLEMWANVEGFRRRSGDETKAVDQRCHMLSRGGTRDQGGTAKADLEKVGKRSERGLAPKPS